MQFVKLFDSITIKGLEIKSRIVVPAVGLHYTHDYTVNDVERGLLLVDAVMAMSACDNGLSVKGVQGAPGRMPEGWHPWRQGKAGEAWSEWACR